MTSTSGIGNTGTQRPTDPFSQPREVDPDAEAAFLEAMQSEVPEPSEPGWSPQLELSSPVSPTILASEETEASQPVDIDNFEPEKPALPKPDEKPSSFLERLRKEIDEGLTTVKDFLAQPEVAKFAQASNIVFAGALVVTAGVLFATGVGAPAGVAALALAGGVGLAMQSPPVLQQLEAGVTAMLTPVLGAEDAQKLSPLLTQGLITGLIVATAVTGAQSSSAKAAVDTVINVFSTMKDVFSGIAQVYENASPLLKAIGVEVDSQAIQNMANTFGMISSIVPDLATFAEGLGTSLKDFLSTPDMDKVKAFITTLTNPPEGLSEVLNSDLLQAMGQILTSIEEFMDAKGTQSLLENLNSIVGIVDQAQALRA